MLHRRGSICGRLTLPLGYLQGGYYQAPMTLLAWVLGPTLELGGQNLWSAFLHGSRTSPAPSTSSHLRDTRPPSQPTRSATRTTSRRQHPHHPGGNPGANLKSISHRCHPILVAFVWKLTKETIYLPGLPPGWIRASNLAPCRPTRPALPRLCPGPSTPNHPGGNPGANLKSISHRCHPILVAFVLELTNETIYLPLGFLQGGLKPGNRECSTPPKPRWKTACLAERARDLY